MSPTVTTAVREFLDPATGQTWTLTYTRTRIGHLVNCEPPFGFERGSRPTYTDDILHARRIWRLISSNLTRRGLVAG